MEEKDPFTLIILQLIQCGAVYCDQFPPKSSQP